MSANIRNNYLGTVSVRADLCSHAITCSCDSHMNSNTHKRLLYAFLIYEEHVRQTILIWSNGHTQRALLYILPLIPVCTHTCSWKSTHMTQTLSSMLLSQCTKPKSMLCKQHPCIISIHLRLPTSNPIIRSAFVAHNVTYT